MNFSIELKFTCKIFLKEKSGRRLTGGNFNELSLTSEDESGKYDRTTEHSRRFLADKSKVAESKGSVRMRNRNQQRDSESTGVWVCSEFSIACSDDFGGAPHRLTTVSVLFIHYLYRFK